MFAKSFTSLLAVAGVASAGSPLMARVPGNGTIVTTTEVVTAMPTWCPYPWNTITWSDKTYTVEGPTWFTITDCPCTRTYTTICTTDMPKPPKPTGDGHEKPPVHPEPSKQPPVHPEPSKKPPVHPEPEPTHPEPAEPTYTHIEVSGADAATVRQGLLAGGLSFAAAAIVLGAAGW